MAEVVLNNIRKTYGTVAAVDDLNITFGDKKFSVLVGPSGCGKSTILRMIAGLEAISSGELFIDGALMNSVVPQDRDIAMVFQNYALYPHMTVYENMAFGLKMRKINKDEIKRRVNEAAEMLEISEYLKRKPKELSGGQRQRVALGRAIVRKPKVFLFDEPLSNIDTKLRVQMRTHLSKLHKELGITVIYVTHDQTEAMTMGEQVIVLNKGKVLQCAAPLEIYDHPADKFTAGFIGSPAMNFLRGRIIQRDTLQFESAQSSVYITIDHDRFKKYSGSEVWMGLRPESIYVYESANLYPIKAAISAVEPMGNESFIYFDIEDWQWVLRTTKRTESLLSGNTNLFIDAGKAHFFDFITEKAI